MYGMMNKGSGGAMQPGGSKMGGPDLAALFRGNQATAPGGMPTMTPQIMAPQTPNIGMPQRQAMPVQTPQRQAQAPSFGSVSDLMKYTHANPGKLSPEMANMWKRSLQRNGGR